MHKYADSFGFILHAELEICFIGEGFQWNEKFVTILLSNSLIIESRKNIFQSYAYKKLKRWRRSYSNEKKHKYLPERNNF
ncbi:hypothetical protein C1638_007255 [Chryseobacterium oncorhynchi]|uniref:Uncharacterized protein n=1 Tax=Chryseobacterium oncorhynchi TaxID=741074 RepID=A0A316WX71_9FLAO|nr:hypothetical protein C1638_007255 [Chryseobacterium oncorhynchi]